MWAPTASVITLRRWARECGGHGEVGAPVAVGVGGGHGEGEAAAGDCGQGREVGVTAPAGVVFDERGDEARRCRLVGHGEVGLPVGVDV
jgi:hypothetical protein